MLLGSSISLTSLWLALRNVPLSTTLSTLAQADLRYVMLALGLVLISPLLRALRWKQLFYPDHTTLQTRRLASILLISQTLNIVLPARTGEIARLYFMKRDAKRSRALTLGTIVIEKWLDLLMILILLLFMPALIALPSWFKGASQGLITVAIAFFFIALILTHAQARILQLAGALVTFLPTHWQNRILHGIHQGIHSLAIFRSPKIGLQIQLWSLGIWILSIFVNYFVFKALQLSLPFSAALFLLAVLQVGIALPTAPGKLGVFHYLCVLTLGFYGIERSTALAYSFLLYLIVFLPPVLLGTLSLWRALDGKFNLRYAWQTDPIHTEPTQ